MLSLMVNCFYGYFFQNYLKIIIVVEDIQYLANELLNKTFYSSKTTSVH